MDVDSDIDSHLMQQFSCMGTTDKDVLISELQKMLGNQLNPAGCAFFLDMNNWNLQAAICSYYDFEQPKESKLPSMSLVKDNTIGEGEAVLPDCSFVKTWRVQNTGEEAWPIGCYVRFAQGDQLGPSDRVPVDPLKPGEMKDISIEMKSPVATGTYQGQWRMCTPTGMFFGETIWVIIAVDDAGLLSVTQQLSNFEGVGHISSHESVIPNPFGTPSKNCASSPVKQNIFGSPSMIGTYSSSQSNSPHNISLDRTHSSISLNTSMFVNCGSPASSSDHHTSSNTTFSSPVKALFQGPGSEPSERESICGQIRVKPSHNSTDTEEDMT